MRLFDGPQGPFSIPAPPCKGDVREEHLPLLNGAHKGFLHREEARRRTYLAQFGARLFAAPFLLLVLALCSASVAEETATGAEHEGAQPFETFIIEASQRFSIPVSWIVEVMAVESTGDVRARSPKGAMGLMQLMPDTWAELRRRHALGSDPFDPRDNILAGTAYLREMLDRFGPNGVFAAYHAGPLRYQEHLAGRPLPVETQAYVKRLGSVLDVDQQPTWKAGVTSSASSLLIPQSTHKPTDMPRTDDRSIRIVPSADIMNAISSRDILRIVPSSTGLFVARTDSRTMQ
ncbi:lytic transglycosylase domain-containing protein (plasmid) [Bradyrhizobium sp. CCBAU 53351]|nr:lytic transglycosylase domain-containing protein [Bradyrhizobium guangdongense]QAU50685.1 lytic transglycosylase domain-containing protein [Bradyrhizobium guangzhouense]QOZ49725.1 lytic transglycosylase domain-containing protein [Bradyrhizobium sp. CCBAU 53340]QOZ56846.1 lytic transglycosylase domain-containing protein [Bradyrhizobium sp. CCBAU 53338]QOZ81486.1 lytic transglycosylase domain-containing protein [Bradyrhizobium sp. CCBAU 53351]